MVRDLQICVFNKMLIGLTGPHLRESGRSHLHQKVHGRHSKERSCYSLRSPPGGGQAETEAKEALDREHNKRPV